MMTNTAILERTVRILVIVFCDKTQPMCTPVVYMFPYCRSFPYTTPGALFRKSTLLDRDFLNSALGLYTKNTVNI